MRISDWSSDVCSSDLVLQTPPISEPGPDPKQSSAAISPNPLPSPTHDAAPATPIDDLIAKKLEPVLAQLAKTEDELAQLKVIANSQPRLSENDRIAWLEKARIAERAECLEIGRAQCRERGGKSE